MFSEGIRVAITARASLILDFVREESKQGQKKTVLYVHVIRGYFAHKVCRLHAVIIVWDTIETS